jgi:flagellar protein FliO/FliZ
MKTGRKTLKNHVRIALAVTVLAAIIAGFPVSGQAKNGGQGKSGTSAPAPAAAAAAAMVDPESKPLDAVATSGGASGATAGGGSPDVSTWDFVRALLVLALVVAAIYLLFHLLKKGAGRKNPENDLIRMLGSRNLTGNRAMHLVEVGKSVFLVGSTDGGVELISEITDQESLDMVRLKAAEEPAGKRRSFQEILADLLKPAKKSSSMNDGLRFLKSQRERLKKL